MTCCALELPELMSEQPHEIPFLSSRRSADDAGDAHAKPNYLNPSHAGKLRLSADDIAAHAPTDEGRTASGILLRPDGGDDGQARSDWYRRRELDRVNPRRSSIIRVLRIAVPSLAAVLLVGTLIWPLLNAGNDSLRQLGKGESAMLNARFEGYDSEERLISITADEVIRSQRNESLIDLRQPLADMTYDDGSKVAIRANTGRYDEESQQLLLDGDVNLFQPNGFEFTTLRLQIDTKARAAWSDQPVAGTGPGGRISGSAVRILQNGRFLVFPGKGKLTLDQLAKPGGAS
jgi:lipopolysaccharide export system protein LptC